jgi:hypothetical protein
MVSLWRHYAAVVVPLRRRDPNPRVCRGEAQSAERLFGTIKVVPSPETPSIVGYEGAQFKTIKIFLCQRKFSRPLPGTLFVASPSRR